VEEMADQENRVRPNDPDAEYRGALTDLTIAVAAAGTYDAIKTGVHAGVQQVKDKLAGDDKTKD
jgi:hypothetical protein